MECGHRAAQSRGRRRFLALRGGDPIKQGHIRGRGHLRSRSRWHSVPSSLLAEDGQELRRRAPRLPDVSELDDPEAKDLLARVRAARQHRAERLGRIDRQSRARLESLLESIVELEATAVRLLLAAEQLASCLADGAGTRVFARAKLLASRSQETADPELGEELLRASQTADQHAAVVAQLAAHHRKLVARVDWIVESLELLSSRLLATEVGGVLGELDPQGADIDDVTTDIESLRSLSRECEVAVPSGHGDTSP
jgi:hypothetical protein